MRYLLAAALYNGPANKSTNKKSYNLANNMSYMAFPFDLNVYCYPIIVNYLRLKNGLSENVGDVCIDVASNERLWFQTVYFQPIRKERRN